MIDIKIIKYNAFKDDISFIRNTVFIKEQNVPIELEYDGLDESAKHILLYINSKAIATGRMLENGHIGRIAVLKEYRGQGFGKIIVESFIQLAKELTLKEVDLSAQIHATEFYTKLGFKSFGNVYLDANIEHIDMLLSFKEVHND